MEVDKSIVCKATLEEIDERLRSYIQYCLLILVCVILLYYFDEDYSVTRIILTSVKIRFD